MTEGSGQNARWTDPTGTERADLTPEEERAARLAFRAWQRYNWTGDRTELASLGILPDDGAAFSEAAEE